MTKQVKTRIEQEIDALVEAGLMSKSDAKSLLDDFLKELEREKDRFLAFAKQELTATASRMKQKAKPVVRKAVHNLVKARKKNVKPVKKVVKKAKKKGKKSKRR